nr:hypothetical protein [Tanacetum cinerariifolium]
VEHKDTKNSNEMYYPRFMKVIIHHFMSKDPSLPRRNKVNWHHVRDDHMFSTIKLVSRHQNTQQFGVLLPIELTNEDIRNSNAYKEYYAVAIGVTPPKPKASVRKTRSSSDTTVTPPIAAAGPRLSTSAKGKQPAKVSKAKNKGTGSIPGVLDVPTDESEEEISWNSTDEEGDDDERKMMKVMMVMMVKKEMMMMMMLNKIMIKHRMMMIRIMKGMMNRKDEESFDPIPKIPENNDDEGNGEEHLGINVGREEGHGKEEEEDGLYRDVNINQGIGIQTTQEFKDSHVTLTLVNPDGQQQSSSVSTQFVTSMLNPTPNVGIELIFETTSQMDVQTPTSVAPLPMSAPTITPPTIATITTTLQAPTPPTIAPSTRLQDLPNFSSLFGFDNRLKTLESNFSEFMQTNQFVGAVSTIPGIRNLYKAFVDAYESDKIILDTYGDTVTLKRRHDDDTDKDEEPSVGSDRGSKRRREGNEPESASAPTEKATRSAGKSTQWSKSRQTSAKLLADPTYELMKGSCKTLVELEFLLEEVYKATTDQLDWVNLEGQQYPHNLLKPLLLIPNNRGLRVIPFDHFINNDLEYLRGGASSHKYTTSVTKTKASDYRLRQVD